MKIAATTVSMDAAHTYRDVDQRFTAMGMVTGMSSGQTDAFASSSPCLQAALQSLRDIVGMQRLRLQMMLTGERLQPAVAQKAVERETFFDWLQSRRQWRPTAAGLGEIDQGVDPGVARVAQEQKNSRPLTEKS